MKDYTIDILNEESSIVNEGKILDALGKVIRNIINKDIKKDRIKASAKKSQNDDIIKRDYTLKKVSSTTEFMSLYKEEALTAEGFKDPDATKSGDLMYDYVKDWGDDVKNHLEFRWCTGKDLNNAYKLTGDNKYPDNLGIFFIKWQGFVPADKVYKGEWRWFSDVCDNNIRREIVNGNKYYMDGHYSSLYGDDWFYETVKESIKENLKDAGSSLEEFAENFSGKYPKLFEKMKLK